LQSLRLFTSAAAEVNKRKDCKAVLTGKREIENYLHQDAISEALGVTVAFGDEDDVPAIVAEKMHVSNGGAGAWTSLDKDKQKSKEDRAKQRLNKEAVAKMTIERIAAQDAKGEIRGWLAAIDGMLKQ
jgi:hypothetical protein